MRKNPTKPESLATTAGSYAGLLNDLKQRIRSAQVRTAMAGNAGMLMLYWEVGGVLAERQKKEGWGAAVLPRLATDLGNDLPEVKGFSLRNLKRMVQFFREYPLLFSNWATAGGPIDGPEPSLLEQITHANAGGIDLAAEEIVVAVPRDRAPKFVRTFGSFARDLHEIRAWLQECGVTTVALESTGNYWVPLYQILEQAGLEVCLVNARAVKGIGGRKTDVLDAQWLQQLHAAGLLRKSFRPAPEVATLRYLI